jgi:hypothetical protein
MTKFPDKLSRQDVHYGLPAIIKRVRDFQDKEFKKRSKNYEMDNVPKFEKGDIVRRLVVAESTRLGHEPWAAAMQNPTRIDRKKQDMGMNLRSHSIDKLNHYVALRPAHQHTPTSTPLLASKARDREIGSETISAMRRRSRRRQQISAAEHACLAAWPADSQQYARPRRQQAVGPSTITTTDCVSRVLPSHDAGPVPAVHHAAVQGSHRRSRCDGG